MRGLFALRLKDDMNTKGKTPAALTLGVFEGAKKVLDDLPEVPPAQKLVTMRQGIGAIRDSITAAKARGYTEESIAEQLKAVGIDISASTLRAYLRPERKRGQKKTPAPREARSQSA